MNENVTGKPITSSSSIIGSPTVVDATVINMPAVAAGEPDGDGEALADGLGVVLGDALGDADDEGEGEVLGDVVTGFSLPMFGVVLPTTGGVVVPVVTVVVGVRGSSPELRTMLSVRLRSEIGPLRACSEARLELFE